MADYDKSAHDMMRFRAGKYSVFERGRFLVAYHEDHIYSVRDEKRGTVTLVEARNPESAYLKASSIRPISSADVVEVVRCGDCYAYRRDPELAKAADLDPEQYCALLRCEFPSDGFCFYGSRGDNG